MYNIDMAERIEVDTKTFIRFWLVIFGLGAAALFIWKALNGLIIVGIALFLAIAIRPLSVKIGNLSGKISQTTATVITFVAVVAGLGFIMATIGPVMISETANFVGQLPNLSQKMIGNGGGINDFGQAIGIENLSGQIQSGLEGFSKSFVNNFGDTVVTSVSVVANLLTGLILVLVLTLLFLMQGPMIMENFWKSLSKQRDETLELTRRILDKIVNVISKYVYGQVTVAIIDGTAVALAVMILSKIFHFSTGLAFPMGMLAMICCLIPMFGPVIGCVLVSVLLFFTSLNIWAGINFLIFYIVYQQIENNAIAPKIQGDALKLPPLIILISVTIGIYTMGILGAIIAIPLAGCAKVLLEEYPNIRRLQKGN